MIRLGSTGDEVRLWQEFLAGRQIPVGRPDGVFGPKTEAATTIFQRTEKLEPDGIVGPATLAAAVRHGWHPWPGGHRFVPAVWFTPAALGREITLVVIHTMEVGETSRSAEAVAEGFARRPRSRAASCHYCIDSDSIVQCVREQDVAWHAGGANRRSIGIEHAGRANQTEGEWADPYSTAMLERSATLVAAICQRHHIPVGWLGAAELLKGRSGITGHFDCAQAYGGTHWDPGPHFPREHYLQLVRVAMGEAGP